MSKTPSPPVTRRAAYQRPYETRQQRREAGRRKTDESNDYNFLLRMGGGIAIVVALVLGFVLKGALDGGNAPAPTAQALR